MVRIVEEYATALMQMADKHNAIERAFGQAFRWLETQLEQPENPAEEMPEGVMRDFMIYLQQKDRLGYARPILQRFIEMAQERIGVVKVDVVSAAPLTNAQLENLQRRLIQRSGKRVRITHRVDSTLIAGLRLTAGGVVMDTSVKGQLADIRDKLYEGGVFYPWTQ